MSNIARSAASDKRCGLPWLRMMFSANEALAGGARRNRTDDLLLAKQALSQLSYGPSRCQGSEASIREHARRCRYLILRKWWAWEDLNFRPHAYQARALTN